MRSNQKIRKLRAETDITQAETADRLRVCRETYALYECGKIGLSVDRLMEIAEILGAAPIDLLPDEDPHGRRYEVQR